MINHGIMNCALKSFLCTVIFTAFSQSILCALESSGGDFYELP